MSLLPHWHAFFCCLPYSQIYYNDTRIQLLDLPGIIEGAAYGRGRGREVRSFPISKGVCVLMEGFVYSSNTCCSLAVRPRVWSRLLYVVSAGVVGGLPLSFERRSTGCIAGRKTAHMDQFTESVTPGLRRASLELCRICTCLLSQQE